MVPLALARLGLKTINAGWQDPESSVPLLFMSCIDDGFDFDMI